MSFEVPTRRESWTTPWAIGFTIAFALFWGLRGLYWGSVEELPFSDMGNFDDTAHRVAQSLDFRWSAFWQTYSTPALVAARAIQILIAGDSMLAWQVFQATLTFAGLAWLAWELLKATGSRGLVLALVLLVALSKPSIFWSLKLSREGFAEAATYFTIAAALFAFRRPTVLAFFAVGLVLATSFLNRPNSVLVVPCMFLLIFWWGRANRRSGVDARNQGISTTRAAIAMAAGIAILWAPWIVRSIKIYGEPVLFSTQGPYSFLWELGEVDVQLPDGRRVKTNVNTLQADAAKDFPTDLAASKYAGAIAKAWMWQQGLALPRIMFSRIRATIANRTEYLTKVPRDRLFTHAAELLVIDKYRVTIYTGLLGLLALPFLYSARLAILPAAALLPWLSAGAIISYARMLEASIPLILFGNVVLAQVALGFSMKRRMGATRLRRTT